MRRAADSAALASPMVGTTIWSARSMARSHIGSVSSLPESMSTSR